MLSEKRIDELADLICKNELADLVDRRDFKNEHSRVVEVIKQIIKEVNNKDEQRTAAQT